MTLNDIATNIATKFSIDPPHVTKTITGQEIYKIYIKDDSRIPVAHKTIKDLMQQHNFTIDYSTLEVIKNECIIIRKISYIKDKS